MDFSIVSHGLVLGTLSPQLILMGSDSLCSLFYHSHIPPRKEDMIDKGLKKHKVVPIHLYCAFYHGSIFLHNSFSSLGNEDSMNDV